MNFDYAKDSKEQRPYEHYLEAYKDLDPEEISERTGFPYDKEKGLFTVHLMGSTYFVSFPDYEIHHEEDSMGVYPLEEAMNAKILIVRYMAERHPKRPRRFSTGYSMAPLCPNRRTVSSPMRHSPYRSFAPRNRSTSVLLKPGSRSRAGKPSPHSKNSLN